MVASAMVEVNEKFGRSFGCEVNEVEKICSFALAVRFCCVESCY